MSQFLSVSSFAQTFEHRGLVASKSGRSWSAARTAGTSQLRTARQFSPLSAVPWIPTASYSGHLSLSVFKFESFTHITNSPWSSKPLDPHRTATVPLRLRLVLPLSLLAECPAERVPVSRGHSPGVGNSSPQKAEAERVPFLPHAGCQRNTSIHRHSRRVLRPQGSWGHLSLELL